MKIKNKDDYINKEHAYQIFLWGISTAKISVTIWLEFNHKILEGINTAKISVTIQIKSSHITLEGISTAKIW